MQSEINFSPATNGTATSAAAATSMREHAPRLRQLVLDAVRRAGLNGLTSDEAEAQLGLAHQTCSARLVELRKHGQVVAAGTRRTRSGRRAVV